MSINYYHKDNPKLDSFVICKFCAKQVKVTSVTSDKFGGYWHIEKHTCVDLSKDKYYQLIKKA